MTPENENRHQRRARERREGKTVDALWGRPITESGADLLARRHGFRFAGWIDPMAHPELRAATETVEFPTPGPRYMAVFVPEPDDGSGVFYADGRTPSRALRRGLEVCRRVSRGDSPRLDDAPFVTVWADRERKP